MTQPFDGIRVVDATHVLAGPFATYQLALLGADVIKLEHPDALDQARGGGTDTALNRAGMGTMFLTQASNKRSLLLDLRQSAGREAFLRLIATADVLVENYRPGAFEALGLGYEALREVNPRLIYCSISAFGQTGPKGQRTAYDHVVQATSGLMYATGTPEVNPMKIGPPVIDYATGTMGSFAIASALLQRTRTHRGQRIDLAMVDTALTMMGSQLTGYLRNARVPRAIGNRLQHATNWAYETRDGLVMLGAANLRQQKHLWELLGRPDMAKANDEERDADVERESTVLAELMLQRTAQEWEDWLQARHVPAARVRTLPESMADAQWDARALVHTFAEADGINGPLQVPRSPFTFEHGGPSIHSSPPPAGQDSEALLSELGYAADEITALRQHKVI
jgi:crotonobetainyl-CoA:carnitine CoA-transferase CaiB-like acyl-CoA transferase